ncbi:MAG: hypothetical protein RL538_461 [Candidatus Parcubacteria bacterium]|jgi:hypothetical protein
MTANTENKPVVHLVKVASIDDVFLALRTTFMGSRVEVTTESGLVYGLSIQSLYHEDGSGRSLMVGGYAKIIAASLRKLGNGMRDNRFEAYLNYKGGDRKGFIRILD